MSSPESIIVEDTASVLRPKKSLKGTSLSDIVINFIIFIVVLVCLLPMLNVIAVSFSSNSAILTSKVSIFPVDPTLLAYRALISDPYMLRQLGFTIILTVTYTAIAMVLTVFAAYALTKKRLKGRSFFLVFITITMYFSGGIIPSYLLVKDLGMIDKFWALVFPGVMSAFNMILIKTFFTELPESFEESAVLDGANEFQLLFKIVIPLSMPVLATIALFYAVGKWNSFMDAYFYINSRPLYPLQLILYQMIMQSQSFQLSSLEGAIGTVALPESMRAATILYATIPILIVYPWLQRYFIKGVMIGGIKG
jgi:putative aldouronate transport system permease protein